MKIKNIGRLLTAGILVIGLAACAKAPPVETTVESLKIELNGQAIELAVGDSYTAVSVVTADGTVLPEPELEWSSSDIAVATVSDGVITAQGFGDATVTANVKYGGKATSATVKVAVKKPVVMRNLEMPVLLDLSKEDGGLVSFAFPLDAAQIDAVTIGNEEYRIILQGEQALIQATHLTPGEYIMTVELADQFVSFPVCIASMVIESAGDLLKATQMEGADKGYFVLANNIDCSELSEPVCFTDKAVFETNLGQNRAGFLGGFHGMGYTISNLTVPENGLFGCIAASGIVRNVAFKNVQADAYVLCKDNAGLISQVYVQGDFSRVLYASYSPTNKLENIVAESTRSGAMLCQHIASVDTEGYSVSEVSALIIIGQEAKVSGWSRIQKFSNLTMDPLLRVYARENRESISDITAEDGFNHCWDITSGYPIFISSNQ